MLRLSKTMKKKIISLVFFLLSINFYGLQFGNGNDISTNEYIKVADDVKSVIAEQFHCTFIIKKDNSLWGTGLDIYRDFGLTGPEKENRFVKLMDEVLSFDGIILEKTDNTKWMVYKGIENLPKDFKKFSAGLYIFGTTLYAEGEDEHGRFGNGYKESYYPTLRVIRDGVKEVYSTQFYTQIITTKNELLVTGVHYLPKPYKHSVNFFKLAENIRYTTEGFYITTNDELYAFGFAAEGALGVGDITSNILPTKIMDNVESVISNLQVSLILKKDGTLYGCGGRTPNYCGELGFGNLEPVLIPKKISEDVKTMAVGTQYTAYVKKDGTLWMCGANEIVGGM